MTMIMTEEEKRKAWAAGRTDVDGLARQADRLIREAREIQAASGRRERQRPARRAAAGDGLDGYAYVHADLKSSADGHRLGRKFNHDASALACHLGITVQYVPLAHLQNPNRPLGTIPGALWRIPGQPPVAYLANTLNGWDAAMTLAHECAHHLGFDREEHCEQFARAFLTLDDSDTPAARWKKMEDDKIRRARLSSIARGKALEAAASRRY